LSNKLPEVTKLQFDCANQVGGIAIEFCGPEKGLRETWGQVHFFGSWKNPFCCTKCFQRRCTYIYGITSFNSAGGKGFDMNRTSGVLSTLIATSTVLISASALAAPMVCSISEKHHCQAGFTCQWMENNVSVRIEFDRKTYSRCDANGCDSFKAQFSQADGFHHINLANVLAKVSQADSTFVEIAAFGNKTHVSFGKCANADQ
jgi:hypothetical protein